MQSIDLDQLSTVRGGIAGLLQAAGPILNGVASIIGAAKSGGGGGTAAAGAVAAAAPVSAPSPGPSLEDPLVSVTVRTG